MRHILTGHVKCPPDIRAKKSYTGNVVPMDSICLPYGDGEDDSVEISCVSLGDTLADFRNEILKKSFDFNPIILNPKGYIYLAKTYQENPKGLFRTAILAGKGLIDKIEPFSLSKGLYNIILREPIKIRNLYTRWHPND